MNLSTSSATPRCILQVVAIIFILVSLAVGRPAATVAVKPPSSPLVSSPFEEPLVATARTTPEEDAALSRAVSAYRAQVDPEHFQVFDEFLSRYPQSGWRAALLTNLGLLYYHYGYFLNAIHSFEQAWQAGKIATEPRAKAIVDRAVGELARMHARLGHVERLEVLLKEIGERPITGPATETVTGAKEGLWEMKTNPGVAFLCGPMALKNLMLAQKMPYEQVRFLDDYRSGPNGVTLAEVATLAAKAKFPYRLVRRRLNQPVPVPSIVHWKVSHFAAIVGEANGRYRVQDPTFGRQELWITRAALDSEASGYFLIPKEQRTGDWKEANAGEVRQIRGMGYTSNNDPNATTPQDQTAHQNESNCNGLCGYDILEMTVSLKLSDTPVGYAPPKGPPVYVTLTYIQREATQPANFSWFNVSPKWTLNWLSYIQDDPTFPGAAVSRYVAGGGRVDYVGYNSSTGAFTPETRDASVLVLASTTPIKYQRNLPDGSSEIYAQSNAASTSPRRVFLTKIVDRFGNAVTLSYDAQLRLTKLTDAGGRNTTFSYGLAGNPLLVTLITDPFGRSAKLAYDSSGRLSQITDVIGLTSQFSYDASSLVDALTTPYGTTRFSFGGTGSYRYLNATDPLGFTERVEYVQNAPGIPFSDPPQTVPQGIISPFNIYINGRSTFFWDKYAYQVAAGDYTKARIKHWTHLAANSSLTANTVESIKYPFENRIWFNYPGQAHGGYSGTLDKPNRIGRVLDDGTTQLVQFAYNSAGKVTQAFDPLGRETVFEYDVNQIDLLRVKQKTSPSGYSIIAEFSYNSQHLPLTYKDAASQLTTYAYNSAGQLTTTVDAVGQTTTSQYDGLGYLSRTIDPNNKTSSALTYDSFGRVASRTDSEGHVVTFTYDALDRVTKEAFPDGTTRQYGWNKLDLVSVTDRQNRVTRYTYDAVRNLTQITDPLNRKPTFARHENGLLKTLTDANGNVTSWDIDVQGRNIAKRYADGRQVTNTYEATTSRLKTLTDALGQSKQYSYAVDDQISGVSYANAVNPTPGVAFSYDPYFRRMASMTDAAGTTVYQYHAPGVLGALQLSGEDGPYQNDAITHTYDALGRAVGRGIDTSSETFGYDKLGRLNMHTSPLGVFDIAYLGQSQQLASKHARGGAVGTDWIYETNAGDRRLKSVVNSGLARSYQYVTTPENIISRITEVAMPGSAWPAQLWDYGYDAADRLLQARASGGAQYAYGYDNADNIISFQGPSGQKAASYNKLNQISTLGSQSYVHDANGNVVDDGARTYKWDAEDRLIGIGYKAQPGRSTNFRYDGLGRRTAIVSNNGAASVETRYLWCGEDICQARSATDAVSRRYYAEGEIIPAGGTLLYYAQDHLGSVRDVLAVQNGSRVASYDYDPYGNAVQASGRISTDFRYAGMFYEQSSGLYLTHYRVYDAGAGRWLSRDPVGEDYSAEFHNTQPGRFSGEDPIGLSGGANLYEYSRNNPSNFTDSSGLTSCPAGSVPRRVRTLLGWVVICVSLGIKPPGDRNPPPNPTPPSVEQPLPRGTTDYSPAPVPEPLIGPKPPPGRNPFCPPTGASRLSPFSF